MAAVPADPKIIDLIKKKADDQTSPFLSLEYFPPRTDEGVKVCRRRPRRPCRRSCQGCASLDIVGPSLYIESNRIRFACTVIHSFRLGFAHVRLTFPAYLSHCLSISHFVVVVVSQNLYARMDRMKDTVGPLFTDVTWGAGGSTAELSLDIALQAHNSGHTANLHMTCTNMAGVADPKVAIQEALQKALDGGIRNIVALRGDPPAGQDEWKAAEGGFSCALDLVKFIREKFGDTFGVSVAGYPEGHPNAISQVDDVATMTEAEAKRSSELDGVTYTCKDEDYKKEMDYLKAKVDAGAGELDCCNACQLFQLEAMMDKVVVLIVIVVVTFLSASTMTSTLTITMTTTTIFTIISCLYRTPPLSTFHDRSHHYANVL